MILRIGTKGQAVVGLKERLASQGFWPTTDIMSPNFTPKLAEAVAYFQQTHQDMYGRPLAVDGVVGMYTEWALKHPTGKAQKSDLGPKSKVNLHIPAGIGELRAQLLITALGEYGVREKPMGSNRGPGVDKYLPSWWLKKEGKGPAWCCFFVSWVTRQVFGKYPLGRNHGSCKKAWEAAQNRSTLGRHMAWPKYRIMDSPSHPVHPMPGDAFYMRWGPRTGHIGFVYRVDENSEIINTIEGNCANRVKVGRRTIDERIFGYIDFLGDDMGAMNRSDFERGLIDVKDVGRDGTR